MVAFFLEVMSFLAVAQITPEATTIRQDVRLVQVDVLVTDKAGKPVPGLEPGDFALKENGVGQKLLHVEEHRRGGAQVGGGSTTVMRVADSGASAGVRYSNQASGGEPVWNVILLDALNTPIGDQIQARKQLWQFVKTLPPGEPIALVYMDSSLHVLVPFRAGAGAIDKLLATTIANPKQPSLIQAYSPDDQAIMEHIQAKMRDQGAGQQVALKMEETNRVELRVRMVLQSLSAVAQWLGQYPGRKNVFWLSTGFPLIAGPRQFASDSGTGGGSESFRGRYAAEQAEMDQKLQLARVAIFPIDVRGTLGQYTGMEDATQNSGRYVGSSGGNVLSSGGHNLNADMSSFSFEQGQEILEEKQVAEDTGGIAKYNSNAIDEMLRSAYEQSQSYYTVSYSPEKKNWRGEYRKMEVSLNKRGYQLAYRRGYYAVDRKAAAPTTDDFTLALRVGAPPAREVAFSTTLKVVGQSLQVDYAIDPRSLQLTAEGGVQNAGVDCAVIEYDHLGKMLGAAQIHVDGKIKPEDWAKLEQSGFPARQTVPLKAEATSVTIGVRDASSGEFGNMQVELAR